MFTSKKKSSSKFFKFNFNSSIKITDYYNKYIKRAIRSVIPDPAVHRNLISAYKKIYKESDKSYKDILKKLQVQFHPDKNKGQTDIYTRYFQVIQKIFEDIYKLHDLRQAATINFQFINTILVEMKKPYFRDKYQFTPSDLTHFTKILNDVYNRSRNVSVNDFIEHFIREVILIPEPPLPKLFHHSDQLDVYNRNVRHIEIQFEKIFSKIDNYLKIENYKKEEEKREQEERQTKLDEELDIEEAKFDIIDKEDEEIPNYGYSKLNHLCLSACKKDETDNKYKCKVHPYKTSKWSPITYDWDECVI